ncbi:putative retrotransposon hot spot (RHS) protein [Trypanosoma cruzi]|uniref:Putative retrotransposon hot spot (RHS) protein n=1 Tax=Trypanosoma cruzi TaxID=5693 RepID=A0A2V2WSI7_TRYCR|nr:putative retrotransposon hot spot (RHS) protein [Trypanosoma cruzi]RNC55095.1 retrotransposon hot spot (RHS) protein [Trypanosoma cruzi]
MHRCCGVYDLFSLHVAAALPNSLPTCFCVCLLRTICTRASILVECVRCRRCHRGAELYRAECVGEPSVSTTLLLALTNTVLGGWHPLAVVAVVLVHLVCITHRVDDSLAEAVSHACDLCLLLLFLFLISGQCSALTQSKYENRYIIDSHAE